MKKGLLLLVVLFSVMLTLAACGGNADQPATDDGAAATGDAAAAGEQITIKMSANISTADPTYARMEAFAEQVNAGTDNMFKFEFYPSSQLGDYSLTLQEVSRGNIETIVDCFSSTIDPRGEIVWVPYACSTYDEIATVFGKESYIYGVMDQVCSDINVKFLGFDFIGFDGMMYSEPAPANIWDVTASKAGLVRTPSDISYIALAKEMGMNGTAINWSEVYSSLQTKVINGAFGPTPITCYNSFRDVVKSYVAMNYSAEMQIIGINMDLWNSFSPEVQQVWQDAADKFFLDSIEQTKANEAEYVQMLKDYGIEYVEGTDEQLNAYAEHIQQTVWPVLEEVLGAETYQGLMDSLNK